MVSPSAPPISAPMGMAPRNAILSTTLTRPCSRSGVMLCCRLVRPMMYVTRPAPNRNAPPATSASTTVGGPPANGMTMSPAVMRNTPIAADLPRPTLRVVCFASEAPVSHPTPAIENTSPMRPGVRSSWRTR